MESNICELQIKKLTASDLDILEAFSNIQKVNIEKEKSFYFIYQQSNLKTDYVEVLSNPGNIVFYATSAEETDVAAFLDYEVSGHSVRLKHVLFKSATYDVKILKFLISDSLKVLLNERAEITAIEVEVFEKNKKLLSFLLSLGMEISAYNYWYDITSYCNKGSFESTYSKYAREKFYFKKLHKQKNFKLLYYNSSQVGTLIEDSHLIINSDIDYLFLKKLNVFFKDVGLQSVSLSSKKELELFLIDKSFHLTIPVKKLKLS
jgi:hypothetical protein